MTQKESWGSRVGLVLAMAGNAVGFGNFLRFPVQAVQNGGGSFIIPYLVCFLLMGIPLLFVEWSIGRHGGRYGHHSTPFMMGVMDKRAIWKYVGVFGIFSNIAIAAYYCYLESWTLAYIWKFISGSFVGKSGEEVAAIFGNYISLKGVDGGTDIAPLIFWLICLFINIYILSKGLDKGVEIAAKIGMPLLILFGFILAIKGATLKAGTEGAIYDGTVGLNFLWKPNFDTIWSPKVWVAAAGQIFFTLSVGMGSIQCYASYVRPKDDIALNAMSAGWMNEFVEVVLGSCIIIPISIGYLGIDKVVELTSSGGLGLGFKTLPYLFQQWGPFLSMAAGIMFFSLLFFAGITSSLAMGTPCISFFEEEYKFSKQKSSLLFGIIILLLGLPTVLFFNYGVFDEYDYWAGTISLVVFALGEVILFSWIFGIKKGWEELMEGADIRIPNIYKYITLYITPLLLGFVFVMYLPELWDKLTHKELMESIQNTTDPQQLAELKKTLRYINISRVGLLSIFGIITYMVYHAYHKRKKEGRDIWKLQHS